MKKLLLAVSATALVSCATPSTPVAPTDVATVAETFTQLPHSGVRFPSADTRLTRIHFGSCLRQRDPAPILSTMVGRDADLTVLLGDNVYGDVRDTSDVTMPELVSAYETLAAMPAFQDLAASSPILATWDDHDFGLNDAGANFPRRKEAEALFESFWNLPADDPARARPGIYQAATLGPDGERVQIILLDTRYFRDDLTATDERGAPGKERYLPSDDQEAQILGSEQEAWLYQTLLEPADVRIIVSSIQVLADGHGWEAWRTMPAARERLGDILERAGVEDALFVSGDRHLGGLYAGPVGEVDAIEVTTSSLNAPQSTGRARRGDTSHEAGPNRLGLPVYEENFGEIDILWDAKAIALTIRDMDGEAVRTKVISFPEQREQYRQH